MALLSKGIVLYYNETALNDLMEIPEIGNKRPEQLDITTLNSERKEYMDGLADEGDEIAFKFLYDGNQFSVLRELENIGEEHDWKLSFSNQNTFYFTGTPRVALNAATPNSPLTYTLYIKVTSDFSFSVDDK